MMYVEGWCARIPYFVLKGGGNGTMSYRWAFDVVPLLACTYDDGNCLAPELQGTAIQIHQYHFVRFLGSRVTMRRFLSSQLMR